MPTLVRLWMHSENPEHLSVTVSGITETTQPFYSVVKEYVRSHPLPSHTSIASRIFYGALSSPFSTPMQKAEAIVSTFASHFQYVWIEGVYGTFEFDLLFYIYDICEKGRPSFFSAIRKSAPFWQGLYGFMRRATTTSRFKREENYNIPKALEFTWKVLRGTTTLEDRDILVKNLIEADLFGVIDEGVEMILAILGWPIQCASCLFNLIFCQPRDDDSILTAHVQGNWQTSSMLWAQSSTNYHPRPSISSEPNSHVLAYSQLSSYAPPMVPNLSSPPHHTLLSRSSATRTWIRAIRYGDRHPGGPSSFSKCVLGVRGCAGGGDATRRLGSSVRNVCESRIVDGIVRNGERAMLLCMEIRYWI